jgi:tudor domain-containing protein 1/4/6/7
MDPIENVDLGSNRKCAEVCYIKNPTNFWIRLEEHKRDYFAFIKNLQIEYNDAFENNEFDPKNLIVGSVYCTFNQKLFEWHRCEILRINERDALVFFTDIGCKELVQIGSLKLLKDKFRRINRFGINCSLNNIQSLDGNQWSISTIRSFTDKVLGKIVTATIISKSDNIFNVDLFLKTQNISFFLIEEGMAGDSDSEMNEDQNIHGNRNLINGITSPKDELHSSKYVQPTKIPCNTSIQYDVEITTIYSPYCFYTQLCKDKDRFFDFEETLQAFYEDSSNRSELCLKKPRMGQMCVAKYSEDDAWYRAVIKEIDYESNTVKVFFIDYGNDDLVKINENQLMFVHENFIKYPRMGILCCLDKIQPLNEDSNNSMKLKEIVDYMYDTMLCRVLVTFNGKLTNECYKVDLSVETKK